MSLFPSRRAARRAQARFMLRFFGLMGLLTVAFLVVVAQHYLLGWW